MAQMTSTASEETPKISRQQKKAAKAIVRGSRNRYYDVGLVAAVLFLCIFGLVMVYSASAYEGMIKHSDSMYFLKKQLYATLIGIGAMLVVSKVDYHIFAKLAPLAWILSIVLMVAVDFTPLGISYNGQKRWFGIAGHSFFQAAEPVKIALILMTAFLCVKWFRKINTLKAEFWICAAQVIPVGLVAWKNLSSGLILLGILFVMLVVACKVKGRFLLVIGLIVAVMVVSYVNPGIYAKFGIDGYRASRILVWTDPAAYSERGGYQVLQGLYAIGSGGFFGKGLGQSMQKLSFVPEAQNDMIFTIICEELGLFGAICIFLLFLFLIWRLMIVAFNAPDMFGGLYVTGVIAHIALQTILNVAVVTNCIPNTGVTLPFFSYGGTSVCFLLFEIGIALGVSNQIRLEE